MIMMIFYIFSIVILLSIMYGIIETTFHKYDYHTRTWYYGSLERHHRNYLKKNRHMLDYFYERYYDKDWYREMIRNY